VKKRVKLTAEASKKKLDQGSAGFRKRNAAEEIATKGRPLTENKNITNIELSLLQSKLSPVISSRRLKSQNVANPAPNDQSELTQYMCILRQQIEFFEVYVLSITEINVYDDFIERMYFSIVALCVLC